MSKNQPYKGIVRGVLSGNSLIINFISDKLDPYMIINIESSIAPRLGSADGRVQDDPHAFDSWNYLRNLCIGKRVLVGPVIKEIQDKNSKNSTFRMITPFGPLKVAHSRVSVVASNENFIDVGENLCQNGWASVREPAFKPNPGSYLDKLLQGQEEAKEGELGIWSSENGKIRNLPIPYRDYQILEKREYTAIVDGLINATSLQLFLLPDHQYVLLQIAGCRADLINKKNPDDSYGYQAYQKNLKTLLHKTVRVRICQKLPSPQGMEKDGPRKFVGCLLGGADTCFQSLIGEGLIVYDPKTAEYAPNANEYIVKEIIARAKQLKIWEKADPQTLNVSHLPSGYPTEFEGVVNRIHSSDSLEISNDTNKYVIYLNNVNAPYFFYSKNGGSETYGFEAREFLRKHYVGQRVRVVVDGCYNPNQKDSTSLFGVRVFATIYHEKKCINEELVKSGFAEYHDSYIDCRSAQLAQIKKADKESRDRKIGIHSEEQHENVVIDDLANFSNSRHISEVFNSIRDTKLEGIIEHITSGGRLFIYVPSRGLYLKVAVNGIISYSVNDRMSKEVYKFTSTHFMQNTVEIVPIVYKYECIFCTITVQNFYGIRLDFGEELIKNGLAEINRAFFSKLPESYISLQNSAEEESKGVWAYKTRHNFKFRYGATYQVNIITTWDPITLSLQHYGQEYEKIKAILDKKGQENALVQIKIGENIKDLCTNDCIVVKYNNNYYRSRIDAFQTRQNPNGIIDVIGIKDVYYIDFCEPKKDIFNDSRYTFYFLPDELKDIESQACLAKLAFLDNYLTDPQQIENAISEIYTFKDYILYAHLVYEDENLNILLTDKESRDSNTLNSLLLEKRYVKFLDHEAPPEFENAKANLANCQPVSTEENNQENIQENNEDKS